MVTVGLGNTITEPGLMWWGNTASFSTHSRKLKTPQPFQEKSSLWEGNLTYLSQFCIMNFYNKLLKQETASQYQKQTWSVLRWWSSRTLNFWCKEFVKPYDDFCVISMTAQVLVLCLLQQLTTQADLLSVGWGQGLMQALQRNLQPKCSITEVQSEWTQQCHQRRNIRKMNVSGKWTWLP